GAACRRPQTRWKGCSNETSQDRSSSRCVVVRRRRGGGRQYDGRQYDESVVERPDDDAADVAAIEAEERAVDESGRRVANGQFVEHVAGRVERTGQSDRG